MNGAERPWTWSTGEEWDYTSWFDSGPLGSGGGTWRLITYSNAPSAPARGRSQTRLMWDGRSATGYEPGFIVEFESAAASVGQSQSTVGASTL